MINGIRHQKELVLIDGIEILHWVSEGGVRGPPVAPRNHPVAITPHRNNGRINPQLQLTDRIGELVSAQRLRYEVAPDSIIAKAMNQFSASAIAKTLLQGERMKILRTLNDVANSRMYLAGPTVKDRTACVMGLLDEIL